MNFFPQFRGGANISRAIFIGCKTILVQEIFDENIDQRLNEKLIDFWK